MNLDAILEVAIGLVAAWLTLSVAVSQVQEWISSWLGWRAKDLEKIIGNMLVDGQLVKAFYNHPYIQSLSEPGKNRGPSYIQASTFSTVLLDMIVNAKPPQQITGMDVSSTIQAGDVSVPFSTRVNDSLGKIKQDYPGFGRMLDVHFPHLSNDIVSVDDSVVQAQTNIENWYNSVQERASGWYKRRAIIVSFVIGLILALGFNVDTVQIASQLWKAPTIRQALVAQATTTAGGTVPSNTLSTLLKPQDYADSLAVPFGWSTAPVTDSSTQCGWTPGQNVHPYFWAQNQCNIIVNLPAMNDLGGWIVKLFGILITGLAAAQGSPFWFNVLNKIINMRGSGSAPTAAQSSATTPSTPTPAPASAPTNGAVG
ncbi:MAG: hypothetical protein WAN58_06175 [Anaerolineales bacterium]